jgi:1-acyl-sn-glycerol-3-phosphate acyltransferase
MFYRVGSWIVWALLWLLTRYEVIGIENVPRSGPVIIVSNHLSAIDPPILGTVARRKVIFMAKEELFRVPFLSWFVRGYEAFPVRRGEADRQAIRKSIEVLRSGFALGLFPEGHRSPDGVLQQAFPGAALVAVQSEAPVVPVAMTGTNDVVRWPGLLLRRKVRIVFGEPFEVADLRKPSESSAGRQRLEGLTSQMMARVAALLPPERRGYYSSTDTRTESS